VTPDFRELRMPYFNFFIEEGAAGLEEIGIHGLRSVAAGKAEQGFNVMTFRRLLAE
jgi:hypothetical protein